MIFGFNAGEVFRIALKIEEDGKLFYDTAQDKIDNNEVIELFKALSLAEVQHREYFASLLAKLPDSAKSNTVWDPDGEMDRYLASVAGMHVFHKDDSVEQKVASIKSEEDAIKLALDFEKDSIVFFLSIKQQTEETRGREMIDTLIYEELAHHKRLTLELLKLKK